ncbi:TcfC E-set like domain-containing protein [Pseudomonas rubra]|uniref:TcfC E-set like domain-containing protein n=1 Tax=Pseudomonas rubra TaxID=2942627 RepID=A0ABT5P2A4_9PSED|nr:TcfC E-set like domain-containing protein [Pseudomonas rubra]MDD1012401.1 TcfC E-set like domain-containing protein [Pseudomonas rubra]MDD1037252.1 TcfC E-set like domain-containing protein [Pseudomonas rubra]MDD1152969.1 TcfC E-set like domain-containing protein [Pseudomonas rubra]
MSVLSRWVAFGLLCLGAQVHAETSVLGQVKGLPPDFHAHFFDVPLAVRVELDGRTLGEAMVILRPDESLQLIEFSELSDSAYGPTEQQRWLHNLADGWPLGTCTRACPDDLLALHYSLVTSQVSILTRRAEHDALASNFHRLPDQGSRGLLLSNQLNLTGGQGQAASGRYAFEAQSSLGQWTAVAAGQMHRSADSRDAEDLRYYAQQLYGEHLQQEHFWRLGFFTPDDNGIARQPRLLGSRPEGTVGVMYGTSDTLAINNGMPSATPIYVTPSRPGVAEVYRNGVLIYSQPVQPGLQALDTRRLPGGIYEVEVRLLEDGNVTVRSEEFIYKPNNWSNPDKPLRYSAFLGQQSNLLSNWNDDEDGQLTAGLVASYLAHPRAILGVSLQRVDEAMQYGSALDWAVRDDMQLYANVFHTGGVGNGFDLQGIFRYSHGSFVLSHNRSWMDVNRYDQGSWYRQARIERLQQSALSWQHRLSPEDSATLRIAHSNGAANGVGVDVGWWRNAKLFGTDASWRLSLFDRPGTLSTNEQRNRGVDLSLNVLLGSGERRVAGSFGSRTGYDGRRDQNASLIYQQAFTDGALQAVSGSLTADRYGAGIGATASYQTNVVRGDVYAQQSTLDSAWLGGLNLDSTLAWGGGAMAATGEYQNYQAGMIVDVETDGGDVELRSDDLNGHAAILRAGRNVVPVSAYKAGSVQFDFAGSDAPTASIQPQAVGYHLNRGGVGYQKIRVMKTLTVIGRLLDGRGQPLKGALLINHASRSVTEADGFFAVEMSERTPTLEVRLRDTSLCLLDLGKGDLRREQDVLFAGDVSCERSTLASAETNPGAKS